MIDVKSYGNSFYDIILMLVDKLLSDSHLFDGGSMSDFVLRMKDQEIFLYLMSVAQEDREVHESLIEILSLQSEQRRSLLDVLLRHSKLQLAPPELQTIFTYFLDDLFAKEVLQYLRTNSV